MQPVGFIGSAPYFYKYNISCQVEAYKSYMPNLLQNIIDCWFI